MAGHVVIWLVGVVISVEAATSKLQSYNVDVNKVSVSGISSGACMATQFHVALSRHVMGAGIIAGAPYMCSGGSAATATGVCMVTPSLINVAVLEGITASAALVGNIDSTYNMRHDKVWIFAGTKDAVVNPTAGRKVETYYDHYISSSANIKTVFNIAAGHGQPTQNYGGPCGNTNTGNHYLNNCGYSAAFHLLNHIYGNLQEPHSNTVARGQLILFDQKEYFYASSPLQYSMDTEGYVYIPSGCADKHTRCKLHIAFHGCQMGKSAAGDSYARHAGYNEVGELNNIIILYPQIITTLMNPTGCWDWYAYTGPLFATKHGFQTTAVRRMMDRVLGTD